MYYNEDTKQAVLYFCQPKILKKSKTNRAEIAQLFSFYIYSDGKLLPNKSESRFGKSQTLVYKVDQQGDNIYVNYNINDQTESIHLSIEDKSCKILVEQVDISLLPSKLFLEKVEKIKKEYLTHILHILFSRFIFDLFSLPKRFGIEEIRNNQEDNEYKRGYLLFYKTRNQACDVLVKKDGNSIVLIRIVGHSSNNNNLIELEKKFQSYISKYSFQKIECPYLSSFNFFIKKFFKRL